MRCHEPCGCRTFQIGFVRRSAGAVGALVLTGLLCVSASAKDKDERVAKLHMIGSTPERPSAVIIERPADFIAIPVNIAPDAKDSNKKEQAAIEIAEDLLKALAKNSNERFKGHMVSTTRQPYIYLLMRTDESDGDLVKSEQAAQEMFKKVFFSGMTRCTLGNASLAVEDPESFRGELMGMIFREVEKLSTFLGEEVLITVSGLESPVQVRNGDGMTVNFFINYRLAVEAKASDVKIPSASPARTR